MAYFGFGTQVNPSYSKQDKAASKKYQADKALKEKGEKVNELHRHLADCNSKLNDADLINSLTPGNVKALVLLRLEFANQIDELLK